jgi:two-component system LytT family sensor kinase
MTTPLFTGWRNKALFTLTALAWAVLHTWIIWRAGFSFETALADSLTSNGLLAGAVFAISNILSYYLPRKNGIVNMVVSIAVICAIWYQLDRYLLHYELDDVPGYSGFFAVTAPVRLAVAVLVVSSAMLTNVLIRSTRDREEQSARKSALEKLSREAELFRLQQQLQPHFLFNSLNSISALVGRDPKQAREMIQQLSDFLRGTLRKEDQQMVTLEEEFRQLSLFLNIEMVRFGHRLRVVIDMEDGTAGKLVPALLLQPVLENAIKYGLYDTTGEVTIRIASALADHSLVIRVENPFDPATSKGRKGTGFGLAAVERRLWLLFARKDLLHTEEKNDIFTTTVIIPQHVQSDHH